MNVTEEIEYALSIPSPDLVDSFRRIEGDMLILGVSGKMGPTLALMAKRASQEAGIKRRVIGAARFSEPELQERLEGYGVETIRVDLLNHDGLNALPDVPNVIYLAGMKFGSVGNEALTWAMNCYLPGMVCERFSKSRVVVLSTGNVYGLTQVTGGGSLEDDVPKPLGDYAMSCLGRERIVQHFSKSNGTQACLIRLNYAVEYRYGVLIDLANQVWAEEPVDLTMGHFNCIWQPDANEVVLKSLERTSSPAEIFNLTGPRILNIRAVAETMGQLMSKTVTFTGGESTDALLSDSTKTIAAFGPPSLSEAEMIERVTRWVVDGGQTLGKPTHFDTRDGKF